MLKVGVDYYPEHWERALWAEDLALMKSAGVNTIRIAEFMWGLLEPEEGQFSFDLLDAFIRDAEEVDMDLILCTPTNCPPVWMYRRYPDTIRMDRDGNRIATGIRGHRCIESPRFLKYAERIIDEMTKRYGQDPHVIGWQIDNELEANHCTCPVCTARWQAFLKDRYETTEAMNKAWGTDIWSGQIHSFEEVQPPYGSDYNVGWLNPGYMLDYERFAAESTARYIRFQVKVLRRRVPKTIPITTNACFGRYTLDFVRSFAEVDVASYDNYPPTSLPDDPEAIGSTAAALDLMRGCKRTNFWIPEQLSGPFGGWGDMQPTPRPGMIEGYALQTIAHGADLLLFWRWRAALKGAETFCQGLIGHDNVPGRRFEEFKHVCRRLRSLGDSLDGTVIRSKVAILFGMEQLNALKIQAQSTGFDYFEAVKGWQYAFRSLGVSTDIIDEKADLSGYQVVVIPAHFVTDTVTVKQVEAFVAAGGTALVTSRSGVKDTANGCVMQPLPGAFASLCGVRVVEYDPIGKREVKVTLDGGRYSSAIWCDLVEPVKAKPIAYYDSEFYAGTPAVTANAYGAGVAFYAGTSGSKALRKAVAEKVLESQGIEGMSTLPEGMDVMTRESADGQRKIHFLFNESEEEKLWRFRDRVYRFEPFEMKIIKETEDGKDEIF